MKFDAMSDIIEEQGLLEKAKINGRLLHFELSRTCMKHIDIKDIKAVGMNIYINTHS